MTEKFIAPEFETLPVLDDTKTEQETNAAIPDEQNVIQAKRWVDENEL